MHLRLCMEQATFALGQKAQAVDMLTSLPPSVDTALALARFHYAAGLPDQCTAALQLATRLAPNDARVWRVSHLRVACAHCVLLLCSV